MYNASEKRYENMVYNRCGTSGLKLPAVSLGLWHNFGDTGSYETMKQICLLHLTMGSHILILQTITGRSPEVRRRISAEY